MSPSTLNLFFLPPIRFDVLSDFELASMAGAMYTSGVTMRWSWCVVVLFITMTASTAFGQQAVHQFTWTVLYSRVMVDCTNTSVPPKDVLGVIQTFPVEIPFNFPGPTVRARQGDRIEVTVTNNISKVNPYGPQERISIHFHGIRQVSTLNVTFFSFTVFYSLSMSNQELKHPANGQYHIVARFFMSTCRYLVRV